MPRSSRSSRSTGARTLRRVAAITTGLAVAAVPVAGLTGGAATAAPTLKPKVGNACKTSTLPPVVKGKPAAFAPGLPAGAWVWHDKRGFHLRVTHDSKSKLVFRGTVTSSGKVWAKRIVRDEKRDVLWRNNRNTAVKFVLRNRGGVDGIDFVTGCAQSVTISLKAAGQPLTTTQIHLGRTGANPQATPVVITRIPKP